MTKRNLLVVALILWLRVGVAHALFGVNLAVEMRNGVLGLSVVQPVGIAVITSFKFRFGLAAVSLCAQKSLFEASTINSCILLQPHVSLRAWLFPWFFLTR